MNKNNKILMRGLTSIVLAGILLSISADSSQVFSYAQPPQATIGLGVSDYESKITLKPDSTERYEVARISNEGQLNFTATTIWVPEYPVTYGNLTVEISFSPTTYQPTIELQANQASYVYATVTSADNIGTFTGEIDFKCQAKLPPEYVGNPSSPGGAAHATFQIGQKIDPNKQNATITTYTYAIIAAVLTSIICGVICGVTIFRWRTKQRRKNIS
jgi:hypothetical protein